MSCLNALIRACPNHACQVMPQRESMPLDRPEGGNRATSPSFPARPGVSWPFQVDSWPVNVSRCRGPSLFCTRMLEADITSGKDAIGVGAYQGADGIRVHFPISIVAWNVRARL